MPLSKATYRHGSCSSGLNHGRRASAVVAQCKVSGTSSHGNMRRESSTMGLTRRGFFSVSLSSLAIFAEVNPAKSAVSEETFLRLDDLVAEATQAWDRGLDPRNMERFKDLYRACDIFDQIVSIDPETTEWLEARGQLKIDAKRFGSALDDFNTAIQRVPENYRLYSSRALAYEGLADWDKAIEDYTRALEWGKDVSGSIPDPYILNSRGNVFVSLGKYREALEDYQTSSALFQRARELDGLIYAASNAALIRIQLGEEKEGLKELAAVARRAPASIDMRAALAAIYWSQGKQQKAEEEWTFACDYINAGQIYDGCAKYRDNDWLRRIRRWPPVMVERMDNFLTLK